MKSKKRGKSILVEITNISPHGVWLFYQNKEYFLSFAYFPWFESATISQIQNVTLAAKDHFFWEDLDIDLSLKIIQNPEKYPLVTTSRQPNPSFKRTAKAAA